MPLGSFALGEQNKQPPAMRVCIESYTKNLQSGTIRCSGLNVEERRLKWQISIIAYRTQNGCVSIT